MPSRSRGGVKVATNLVNQAVGIANGGGARAASRAPAVQTALEGTAEEPIALGPAPWRAGGFQSSYEYRGGQTIPITSLEVGVNKGAIGNLSNITAADDKITRLAQGRMPDQATGAAPGAPAVASNASVSGGNDWTPLALGVGMAGIGGTASWLTGGSFTQGAIMGAGVGFGGAHGAKWLSNTTNDIGGGMLSTGRGHAKSFFAGKGAMGSDVGNMRLAMMGGAGLGGMIFGGRRNHSKGFNSRRGSRI